MYETRNERLAVAKQLLTGSYFSDPAILQLSSQMDKETVRISELEYQLSMIKMQSNPIIADTRIKVETLEKQAKTATDQNHKISKLIAQKKALKAKVSSTIDAKLQSDMVRYKQAIEKLSSRISQTQSSLDTINQIFNDYESEKQLHDQEAQDILLQLRAMLAAQEKELRTFSHSS